MESQTFTYDESNDAGSLAEARRDAERQQAEVKAPKVKAIKAPKEPKVKAIKEPKVKAIKEPKEVKKPRAKKPKADAVVEQIVESDVEAAVEAAVEAVEAVAEAEVEEAVAEAVEAVAEAVDTAVDTAVEAIESVSSAETDCEVDSDVEVEKDPRLKDMQISPRKLIRELSAQGYIFVNVGKDKKPMDKIGETMQWKDKSPAYFKSQLTIEKGFAFGMMMGLQENGRRLMSIDFDVSGDKDPETGERIGCAYTAKKLQEYFDGIDRFDGLFSSSTEGNHNVVVDYTDIPQMVNFEANHYKKRDHIKNLELFFATNQVVPPTRTINKFTEKLGQTRAFLGDKPFYVMKAEDEFMFTFLKQLFSELPIKAKREENFTPVDAVKMEPFHTEILDNINPDVYGDYSNWLNFIWAIKFSFIDPLDVAAREKLWR